MIKYNEAIGLIKDLAPRFTPQIETVDLLESVGRILAEDVRSGENIPYADNSAMDGFAVHANSTAGATKDNPIHFVVKSIIAAGDTTNPLQTSELKSETCVEIMTGALIPDDYYDAVIKVEDIERTEGLIKISTPIARGTNIRPKGSDFVVGQKVLSKNTVINEQHVMALAALGISEIQVKKKMRVAVVSTGNELVAYNEKITKASQVRNSSAPFLKIFLEKNHCKVDLKGIQHDSAEGFFNLMNDLLKEDYDLIVTTGAVSMGKWDFILSTLNDLKMKKIFHKVAIRPGKPILFAESQTSKTLLFGLPGNPISTAVGAQFFVMPLIEEVMKLRANEKFVVLEKDINKPEGLECFFKANINEGARPAVEVLTGQASYQIHSFVQSNCWVQLPAEASFLKAGTMVKVKEFTS